MKVCTPQRVLFPIQTPGYQRGAMGKVVHLNTLEPYLEKIKRSGGMWRIDSGKYAIKHHEVEKLANHYNIDTEIMLVHCELEKGCAVVQAVSIFQGKKFHSLGEVSPANSDFPYPVAMAEKRAVDRAVLKAVGIHGEVYSDVELPAKKTNVNENTGIDFNQASIIMERLKNIRHLANLKELQSDNKEYLLELRKKDSKLCAEVVQAIQNKQQQLS